MQRGECRVLLNGTDVGCPNGAAHHAFQNGRHLVNFPTEDLAVIGFSGSRLQFTDDRSSVLWLDGVYISQQRLPADGQCSFKREAAVVELRCSAILRDGRKLVAQVQSSEQKETILGVSPPVTTKSDCEQLLELHGMLSRAQFQCNFSAYKQSMLDDAKRCAGVVGGEAAKKQLASGMEIFDYNEQKRGRAAMCKSVLDNFPDFVRK